MWTDNETADDLLGFNVHADLLKSLVTDSSMLPVTIGLYGDWGSGKSSVMRMLQRSLDPDLPANAAHKDLLDDVAVLYFNGWTFEGYDDAKAALLSTILIELAQHKRFGPQVRDGVSRLLRSVDLMRAARTVVRDVGVPLLGAYLTGGATIIPDAARVFASVAAQGDPAQEHGSGKQAGEPDIPSVRAFRDEFAKLLHDASIKSLVVLIDDLDRCSPERILENLEAIKLFLNVECTAFVIGADPRIVRHAVGIRYPRGQFGGADGQADAGELSRDYLEKLIQVPYSLPRLSPAEVESYMTLLFCGRELDQQGSGRVVEAVRGRKGRERYARFGYPEVQTALAGDPVPTALSTSLTFVKAAAPLVTTGLKGNPRQVKRFLNGLMLRKRLAEVAELDLIDDVLVKLQVLEYTRDTLFLELNSWQQQDEGFPKRLLELESQADLGSIPEGSTWAEPFVIKWLSMSPRLGGVDLTEYFWVARDRLSAAYGAMDLMPAVVRSALQEMSSDNKGRQSAAVDALVRRMDDEDLRHFLRSLGSLIVAKPKDAPLSDAFVLLSESEIPGAPEAFASALGQVPPDALPPHLALQVQTLMKAKGLSSTFQELLSKWAKSNSPVGRALAPKKAVGR